MLYDPTGVRAYYDAYGTREWERLEGTLQGRIKYAIHRRFLDKYVQEGARVLDVGCGPGRFALDLARRGAIVTLADLSPTQLEMARQHMEVAGLLKNVRAFHCLDLVAMHELDDNSYEVVVCFGGALSYTYDRYEAAIEELHRVICPGGWLLLSVMSLIGTLRWVGPLDAQDFLELPEQHIDWETVLSGGGVAYTRPGSSEFHQPLVLFTSDGLAQATAQAGLQVIEMATANPLVPAAAQIPRITASVQAEAALTALEVALCSRSGLVDTGEHLLLVAHKP